MRLGREMVTIVRASAALDVFGDPVPDAAELETTVPGCSVQPHSTAEHNDQRDTVNQVLTAWLPPATDVTATDRLRWRGNLYQVDGQPQRWDDRAGHEHHIAVSLRRVTG